MTISSVAVGEAVKASTMNQIIAHVNNGVGRAIYTANGSWAVPNGVHQFRVYLAGGGGAGGRSYLTGVYNIEHLGGFGGPAPLISAVYSGVAVGTTFPITIGLGAANDLTATGGTSSFGSSLISTGGGFGSDATIIYTNDNDPTPFGYPGNGGAPGSATFPPGAPSMFHLNALFGHSYFRGALQGYGGGGDPVAGPGRPGICVIEW